jgi:type II secretion system protein I
MKPSMADHHLRLPRLHDGFTLLEVLVALAVLSIVLVSAARWTAWALANGRHSASRVLAMHALEEALVSVSRGNASDAQAAIGSDTDGGIKWQIEASATPAAEGMSSDGLAALKRIELIVRGADGEIMHRLVTFRHVAGEDR